MKKRIFDMLKDKYEFVEKLNNAYAGQGSITKVEYIVLDRNSGDDEDYDPYEEYVCVEFIGGAKCVRNVYATSELSIAQEISKLLFGGYYDEVRYFDELCSKYIKVYFTKKGGE